jgi:hypothetical protein
MKCSVNSNKSIRSRRNLSGGSIKRKSMSTRQSKKRLNKKKYSTRARKQKAGGCGCKGALKGGNRSSIYGAGVYWPSNLPRPW